MSVLNYIFYTLFITIFFYYCPVRVNVLFLWRFRSLLSAGSLPFQHFIACKVSQRMQRNYHKHWIQNYVRFYFLITIIEDLNSASVLNGLNRPRRRQRITTSFPSLCFGHSCISCDTLTVAVSWWQHVIVPLQSH